MEGISNDKLFRSGLKVNQSAAGLFQVKGSGVVKNFKENKY